MGKCGDNGISYNDIPPMPNTKVNASTFPTVTAPQQRQSAMWIVDMQGMVTLTHNSSAATPTFTCQTWSDVCGFWSNPYALACAQYGQITFKVFPNTPIYIWSSVALVSGIVVVGGVTIQGNSPNLTAG